LRGHWVNLAIFTGWENAVIGVCASNVLRTKLPRIEAEELRLGSLVYRTLGRPQWSSSYARSEAKLPCEREFSFRLSPTLLLVLARAPALAADRARPPFIPPLLPQFLNISITALGSSARSLLLWRLAIPSEF